ncbi:MAG: SGNH/GDSL hydrolase family protein [Clostridiales bacterium]|nr:SGNH/GDSL hydrolase family protein [Clostridiales bacterium]
MSGIYEGRLISEYYGEAISHDVIFLGDCEVYENISPITLWKNYGISSYIRGGPQQLIWQSYYLLEDTLRYEKPSVVVFSVLSMQYNKPQKEGYNRLNIDGMPLTDYKMESAKASAMKDESLLSYVFPLLRYHDRWKELCADDFQYYFSEKKVSVSGFMMRCDVKPVDVIPDGKKLPDYQFGKNSYKYLDMLTKLCKDKGIRLILIKTPSIYPYWYKQWNDQMADYADKTDLTYINCLDLASEIGIDYYTDTYDAGLHLNVYGAEKMGYYLGNILADSVPDRRDNPKYASVWNEKVQVYNWLKATQEREVKEFSKIKTFTY